MASLAFLLFFLLVVLMAAALDFKRVERAHELLANGSVLVDVDPRAEFLHAHPHGAINIPLEDLARLSHVLDPTHVVVVHGHWFRGFLASRELRAHGFYVLNLGPASI